MSNNWTKYEVEYIVREYFQMLTSEINNKPYSKTESRNKLKYYLNNRSDGSIEFKHQNISAILIKYGIPYIIGYKPRSNYQKILEDEVLKYLSKNTKIDLLFDEFCETEPVKINLDINFSKLIENPPNSSIIEEPEVAYNPKIKKVNYLEREQRNRKLGELGEELVIEFEKWRLIKNNKEKYVDKIEWISKEQGDGAGFDILSRNDNGTDRYIEVKTTKLGKLTPIYFTKNELKFSQRESEQFYLYRVFQFNKNSRMFITNGSIDRTCKIEPISYIGRFK